MKFRWEESTCNRLVCDVRGLRLEVSRSRSWRRLGHTKPWSVTVFGRYFYGNRFAELHDAQGFAEAMALAYVKTLWKSIRPRTRQSVTEGAE